MHKWSDEEKEYLKEITPGHHYKEIQDLMNARFKTSFTLDQIKAAVARYKLNTGFTGRFEKGQDAWNKGIKGIALGGKETQFKKGNKPHNWVPIGSERLTKDGYIQVKVQEGKFQHNWKGKHIIIWEEHNGEVPEGHAVLFADGNMRNLDIDNLMLVSRAQLLLMNRQGLIRSDTELTKTGALVAQLQDSLNKKRRTNHEK